MENRDTELHAETDEVRGGSTPHVVRWVLIISTLLAIVLLSIIWMTGALTQGDVEEEATVDQIIQDTSPGSDTDGVVLEGTDEIEDAPQPGSDQVPPGRVAN